MSLVPATRTKKRPRLRPPCDYDYQPLTGWLRKHSKKNEQEEKKSTVVVGRRGWDEMDHEILISIFKRLEIRQLMFFASLVCKSWLNAILDILFPPGDVLNLNCLCPNHLSAYINCTPRKFCAFLELHLKRQQASTHTNLVIPGLKFSRYMCVFIAQRLPQLKTLSVDKGWKVLKYVAPLWKDLEEIHCDPSVVDHLYYHFNHIRRLSLRGVVTVSHASRIAENLPRLTHLSLAYCCLLNNALSIILEGKRNLIYLDTRHAYLSKQMHKNYDDGHSRERTREWDDEVLAQVSGMMEVMTCARRTCSYCSERHYP